ncbi:MAG: hypothetical protein WCA49_15515 [Candidatus Sulfotelmatobacter sp.]
MFRLRYLILLFFSFLLAAAHAKTTFDCPASKDYQRVHRINGYLVQMLPGPKKTPYRCRGTITPPKGARVTVAQEWALSIDEISGNDINGGGTPDVVFDAFSGGENCCYLYWIVSLKKKPEVIREIRNQVPLVFRKRPDGGTEIRTGEGSFDLFFLPHSASVIPELVLRLDGDQLVDIGSEYREEYDRQIAKARSELSAADLEKFRQSRYNQKMFADQLSTVKRVLTVVLNYLYSGREQQAWQALDEMWPPSDKERVRGLILERQARGLLAHGAATPSK